MILAINELPHERRNFVHKRIIGGLTSFVASGFNPLAAVSGFTRPPTRAPVSRAAQVFQPLKGLTASRCIPPRIRDPRGSTACVLPSTGILGPIQRALPGGFSGFQDPGVAVMGRFGAALEPQQDNVATLRCLPGMVLGMDELCYNRKDIRNSDRRWPRGTRPLGTPGEMACLRKAASFGRRMETTVKRMQKIGVLKKPSRGRRAAPAPRARQLSAGPSIINVE